MSDVGIIGSGYSGLTLALRLQQLGVSTTVYAEATPEERRASRLPNTVGRFPHTLARERALGVDYWSGPEDGMDRVQVSVGPPLSLAYEGRLRQPMQATDFRVLLSRLLEEYARRGGAVVFAPRLEAADVARRAHRHRLVVVAVGRRSMSTLFPVDPQRSPYRAPQRLVFAGLFHGLARPPRRAASLNLAPGVGEIVQVTMRTRDGLGTNILVEAVPGGPLEPVATLPPTDEHFLPTLVERLQTYAPAVAARIDPTAFALAGPRDWAQVALTPAVRRAWHLLPSGRLAVAIGDAWITNDPITAQGANLGSHSAWVAAEHIAAGGPFDTAFGRRLEDAMWAYAGPVTASTNAFLQPPPPHAVELLVAAARQPEVADRYVNLFDDPVAMWHTLSSPTGVAAFIAGASQATAA